MSFESQKDVRKQGKINCQEKPYHTWCLTSFGKECSKYEKVVEKPVKNERDKNLLVYLHNRARMQVNNSVPSVVIFLRTRVNWE